MFVNTVIHTGESLGEDSKQASLEVSRPMTDKSPLYPFLARVGYRGEKTGLPERYLAYRMRDQSPRKH